ncbi:MAG TPA: hypothetical protein VMZ31_12265 [Phycisphaerae bacterium]|nr:hypothetical protein [Phycisphaerae bacterium]
MADVKQFCIATPIVWAGAGPVTQFAGDMDRLISSVNEIARNCGEAFELTGAFLDVHSTEKDKLCSFRNVIYRASVRKPSERTGKGMGHWWYTCVDEAINRAPSVNAVLYYPVDVCWDDSAENTVVNAFRLCGMLKHLSATSEEVLLLGNYASTNARKELIEEHVLHLLREAYPMLKEADMEEVTRVRTEFWAITPGLFRTFKSACLENGDFPVVPDPTLLLLIYCLEAKARVDTYDLGMYRAEGDYDNEKVRKQIERAKKIVSDFKGRFLQRT